MFQPEDPLFTRLIARGASLIWLLGLLCGIGAGALLIYALSAGHAAITPGGLSIDLAP